MTTTSSIVPRRETVVRTSRPAPSPSAGPRAASSNPAARAPSAPSPATPSPSSPSGALALSDGPTAPIDTGRPERARDRGVLVTMGGPRAGFKLVLPQGVSTLGRGRECTAQFDEVTLSRVHARVRRDGSRHVFEDAGSTNGSFVNEKRVDPSTSVELADGDRIRIGGSVSLRFLLVSDEEERALSEMYDAAARDALTGVFNRHHLEERLVADVAYAARHAADLSILVLEVDHLRQIERTHGAHAMAIVLRRIATILTSEVRAEDVVAHYRSDQFAIVARGTSRAGACLLAERLRRAIASTQIQIEGARVDTTISVGIASLEGDGRSVGRLLACAEERAHWATASGRNCVVST